MDALKNILEIDNGSKYMGEIALIEDVKKSL